VLLGFGSSTTETIDGLGEATQPPQEGGFAFTVPYDGVIQDLQVSADLFVVSTVAINTVGLQYDFTLLRSSSFPNNGIDQLTSPYVSTPLTSFVHFGFPNTLVFPGMFRSASNLNPGALFVNAGDRIALRVRPTALSDPAAADISQLSFSASVNYTRTP
jgi:hypothetical protein